MNALQRNDMAADAVLANDSRRLAHLELTHRKMIVHRRSVSPGAVTRIGQAPRRHNGQPGIAQVMDRGAKVERQLARHMCV
jgi:hypothetical protein